jgi:hypothetical protein
VTDTVHRLGGARGDLALDEGRGNEEKALNEAEH